MLQTRERETGSEPDFLDWSEKGSAPNVPRDWLSPFFGAAAALAAVRVDVAETFIGYRALTPIFLRP